MKERILSGIIMAIIVIAVLFGGYSWSPFCITVFLGLLGMASMYELLHNAAKITKFPIIITACMYAVVAIFACQDSFVNVLFCSILYCVVASIWVVLSYDDLNAEKAAFVYGVPTPFVIAFCTLNMLVNNSTGLYYLILLFGFSSICDMGAYFVGPAIGKHKLCPKVSPKKTIEGAIGGIGCSIVFTIVVMFAFNKFNIATIALCIPMCMLGIIGDLFASTIKRFANLKDFSNLIPGHGGVLDRLDSILMIAPTMFLLYNFGII